MEYTTLSQICAFWLVISFVWGRLSICLNIGKRFGDIKIVPWRFRPDWLLFQTIISIFILAGTGFFHEWHWPQLLWLVITPLGMLMMIPALILIRTGALNSTAIEYNFSNFFGDVCVLLLYYFGHVYGPLGLNPWPL